MQILIRAPQALKDFLKEKAESMGITLNALILQILWEWVENKKNNNKPAGEEVRAHEM